ncbi:hypothetical protein EMCG_01299 [[Emmonsia] crescens]|uniref:Uncharacterized protein n=1 Tax=[Emmonsia] crescens TaxID=73230 RepID=A0A0G2J3J2_9EURO|nr:hypothetical protein EMCG_01299 [Emmonsia crescens UAMH 3008]
MEDGQQILNTEGGLSSDRQVQIVVHAVGTEFVEQPAEFPLQLDGALLCDIELAQLPVSITSKVLTCTCGEIGIAVYSHESTKTMKINISLITYALQQGLSIPKSLHTVDDLDCDISILFADNQESSHLSSTPCVIVLRNKLLLFHLQTTVRSLHSFTFYKSVVFDGHLDCENKSSV